MKKEIYSILMFIKIPYINNELKGTSQKIKLIQWITNKVLSCVICKRYKHCHK